jgi:3-phytase
MGGGGSEPGSLDRPNGIAVVDDLMWVVERDNARVQVFTLPDFRPIGIFGGAELRKPYGIAIVPEGDGVYATYITDNYEFVEDEVPADSLLGERIRHFRVTVRADGLTARVANTFGDTAGPGVLRVVESIAVDPTNDRLLIAEEQEGASMIKVYTLGGRFTGEIIDARFFSYQAEGIVLYGCDASAGYWVATDQSTEVNTFHVFDRISLEHLGSFRGRTVLNTDGIALTQTPFDGFTAGAFFAVHNDGSVAAFRWADIAGALGLRSDCTARPASAASS